ncbi:MAG TPA: NUDIX hydrolase [Burkholderiaceae bacterium]|nr:NUDIX hydrolase [Burkholderiaceae bacterium]
MKDSVTVYSGKVVNISLDQVDLPNGRRAELEIIHHPGGAAAVALDADGRVCLLRQFRHAAGGWIWELPAGKLEPQESPELTATRELEEEAGRRAARWVSLGYMLSSPGVFDERIYLFLARDLTEVPLNHEIHESIEVHWLPFTQALHMAQSGEILDSKTIAGLFRAQAVLAGVAEFPSYFA